MTDDIDSDFASLAETINEITLLLAPAEAKMLEALGAATLIDRPEAERAREILGAQVKTVREFADELAVWLYPDEGPPPRTSVLRLKRPEGDR